uniref:Reverse transcriptase domain-containing protein n=1 Tax=Strongyloides venezuelensis TaxID=75913 RepID=A0A0K0FGJ7_STRVS
MTRLPIRARNSPIIYQRILEKQFENFLNEDEENVVLYQDDILYTSSSSIDHHHHTIFKIFQLLNSLGVRQDLQKCAIGRESVCYLGWLFKNNTMSISKDSALKILKRKKPETGKQ